MKLIYFRNCYKPVLLIIMKITNLLLFIFISHACFRKLEMLYSFAHSKLTKMTAAVFPSMHQLKNYSIYPPLAPRRWRSGACTTRYRSAGSWASLRPPPKRISVLELITFENCASVKMFIFLFYLKGEYHYSKIRK